MGVRTIITTSRHYSIAVVVTLAMGALTTLGLFASPAGAGHVCMS
jgi:hypothetical protein